MATIMKTIPEPLLDDIVRRLVAEFDPDRIILFGSHAWGMPHEDSDIDLLVIVPHSEESPYQRAVRGHRCLRGIRAPFDIIVETWAEFDRVAGVGTSLERKILEEGKTIHGRGQGRAGSEVAYQGIA
ncbi:MAG TPA: nucleotidyltransferase domain-containing protein [Isosphaeraceae bacterium]|nr:nucleotidyltransferase domain-containing protein [Isosphaeraceae bacterium]